MDKRFQDIITPNSRKENKVAKSYTYDKNNNIKIIKDITGKNSVYNYHGQLGKELESDILSNQDAVYVSGISHKI